MNEYSGRAARASLAVLSCALLSTVAFANAPKPGHGKTHHVGAWEKPFHQTGREPITSGTWTPLSNSFPGTGGPETALLMMNGTVIVHDACTPQWYRLTPDSKGQYVTGTWKKIGAMPSGYGPLYYASQVLPNGNVIMNGGEYNGSSCSPAWTTLGALYNAKKDKWTAVTAPSGWGNIGDAQSVVLKSGTYMLADCCNQNQALATIKKSAVTWTATGTGKADDDDEEGWTLLPNGNIFTVDVWQTSGQDSAAELYNPSTGSWSATTTAPEIMADPSSKELGPAVLLPNDSVFQVGTNPCAASSCASHSATYDVTGATWTTGPDLPKVGGDYYSTEDAPAVVLPDGNVLVQMSPSYYCGSPFCSPSHFFEYDGTQWGQVNDPGQAPSDDAYEGRFLPLPSGQILWTSDQGDVEIYTPAGNPKSSSIPKITTAPTSVTAGTSYTVKGKKFEGVSDGAKYGDDAQMAENYPIVRITNSATGDVCFATTTKFSAKSATIQLPASGCETGASSLQVIVNAIASSPSSVTVD